VQVGAEELGGIERLLADLRPGVLAFVQGIDLLFPQDLKLLALGIVIYAGKADLGSLAIFTRNHILDQILALPDANDVPRPGYGHWPHQDLPHVEVGGSWSQV